MGSLEARGVAEGDRTGFWQAVIVDLFFWWLRMAKPFATSEIFDEMCNVPEAR